MKRTSEHGSALVVAVIVVLVISVFAVGLIRLGTLETAGAMSGARREALVQCAEAGANLVLSKFHVLSTTNPVEITAVNVPLDGPLGQTRAVGGHFDTFGGGVQIDQVVPLPAGTAGKIKRTQFTNTLASKFKTGGAAGSGGFYKVTVHCWDQGIAGDPTSGRQLEVELAVRINM